MRWANGELGPKGSTPEDAAVSLLANILGAGKTGPSLYYERKDPSWQFVRLTDEFGRWLAMFTTAKRGAGHREATMLIYPGFFQGTLAREQTIRSAFLRVGGSISIRETHSQFNCII